MKKYLLYFGVFAVGFALAYVYFSVSDKSSVDHSALIAYEIKKLNNLVVLEENYSSFYTHEDSSLPSSIGDYLEIDDKKIVLLSEGKSQVTYNMNELEVEIHKNSKIISINKIPEPKITFTPNVKVYHYSQGLLNKFSEKELKGIMSKAEQELENKQDKKSLKAKANKQLLNNLQHIFVVGKSLGYTIEDNTGYNITEL